ncbi:MAG: hypothetical protein MZU97_10030 [Bacillus subtilis]|nr:hypothetical protein [Bacillus subtilis]
MDAVMNYEISYPIWQFFGTFNTPGKITAGTISPTASTISSCPIRRRSRRTCPTLSTPTTRCAFSPAAAQTSPSPNSPISSIFTFCGSPVILYGDEIGLRKAADDPDSRRCMTWDDSTRQNHGMFDFMRSMIALRKSTPGFQEYGTAMASVTTTTSWSTRKGSLIVMMNVEFRTRGRSRIPADCTTRRPAVDSGVGMSRACCLTRFASLWPGSVIGFYEVEN